MSAPNLFVLYSWSNSSHEQRVLELATALRVGRTGQSATRQEVPKTAQRAGQGVDEGAGGGPGGCAASRHRSVAASAGPVYAADVHQGSLEHAGIPAQMYPAQPPGFVKMGVRAFEEFAAPTQ